jgi:precorrin-8X/cobalt-precorrin-8 methylmutase
MTTPKDRRTGVIVLAHGSKRKAANDDVRKVVEMLRAMRRWDVVEPAFLQFASPTLAHVAERLAADGCGRVVVIPLLLFTGQHVTSDIPEELATVKEAHKNVCFIYADNIGPDPRIAQIAADRIEEALRGK